MGLGRRSPSQAGVQETFAAEDRIRFRMTRLVRAKFDGVGPDDPWTITSAAAGLAAAGSVPAVRASRADPMRARRWE